MRRRPPSRFFTFEYTSRSASWCCSARPAGRSRPSWRSALARRPTRSGPVDEPAARAGLLVEGRAGRLVHLLEDARHAGEQRRVDLRERVGEARGVGDEGDGEAPVDPRQVEEPPEVVRERQPEEHDVACAHQLLLLVVERRRVRVGVPVGDHAGLRRAGGSRRKEEGVEVVLADGRARLVEGVGVGRGELPAAGGEVVKVGEGEDVLDPGDPIADLGRAWRSARRPRR